MLLRPPRRRGETRARASERDLIRVLAMTSLLLGYPDESLYASLDTVRAGIEDLAEPARTNLVNFVADLATTPMEVASRRYVETFDLRRACCLYLTYPLFGDTRKRGMALLAFTDAFRRSGFDLPTHELPDHLGLVCNFAAVAPEPGVFLLDQHSVGIELLRAALFEASSPYMSVIDALRVVLPEPTEHDIDRALELARTGPPAEEIGLEPFAPPEYMGAARR